MSDLFKDVKAVLKDRGKDYGQYEDLYGYVADMWGIILGTYIKGSDVLLCMAALKLCREKCNPKKDNVVDMIGYIKLYYDDIHSEPEATPPPAGEKV